LSDNATQSVYRSCRGNKHKKQATISQKMQHDE